MNGFSDRGSTPLSSIIKKPKKCSDYKGFREFRKCEIGRFRLKKTSLKHTNWGIKNNGIEFVTRRIGQIYQIIYNFCTGGII